MRLSFSKEPQETGLSRVSARPRGAILKVGDKEVGRVAPLGTGLYPYEHKSWYWYVGTEPELGIAWKNTSTDVPGYATIEEAKAALLAYVKGCIAAKAP